MGHQYLFGTGWGNDGDGNGTRYVNQVHLEWVSQGICEQDMGSEYLPDQMICAGDGGRDTSYVS